MNNNETNTKPRFFQRKFIYISLTLFFGIALSIAFFFILYNFKDVNISLGKFVSALKPFIYGGIIAYLLVPMCNFFEKWIMWLLHDKLNMDEDKASGTASVLGIILSLFTAAMIIYVLLSLIIPQLIVSLTVVSKNLSSYYDTISEWLRNTFKDNETVLAYVEEFTGSLSETISGWLKTELLPNTRTLVSSLSSGVINAVSVLKNLFIGLIVSIYLLKSRQTFAAQSKILVHSILKEKYANMFIKEVQFANKMFMGFVSGRLVDSAIMGVLCCIGLTILNVPYAFLVSVLVGVTNVIPFFGPFIGGIPSGFLILMVDPVKCIWFLIFIIILQQIDGNIIGPKILGEMTNLNSFWVLFAIMLFSGLFGFAGMLVGVPVFAVIYHLSQELILKGLNRTGYTPTPEEAEISKFNDFIEERKLEQSGDSAKHAESKPSLISKFIASIRNNKDSSDKEQ